MMRFFIGFITLLLAAGPVRSGDDDSFESPVKRVEKFNGSKTDTFEDSDGDGLNDSRRVEGEKKSPFKGLIDAIFDRVSSDGKDVKKVSSPQPAQEKTQTQPKPRKVKKPEADTDKETKTNRSGSKTR